MGPGRKGEHDRSWKSLPAERRVLSDAMPAGLRVALFGVFELREGVPGDESPSSDPEKSSAAAAAAF